MIELFKTPFGSRLYGTFTEKSDYDWKVVFLPTIESLLLGDSITKNIFYSTSNKNFKNTSDDTDIEYIPFQTLCRDVVKGQAYAIEVAFAMLHRDQIEGTELYIESTVLVIKELLSKYLTSHMNVMVGYAYHQAKLYGRKGDRLTFLERLKVVLDATIADGFGDKTIHALAESNYKFQAQTNELVKIYPEWFTFDPIHIDDTNNRYYSFKVFNKTYLGTSKVALVGKLIDKVIGAYGARAKQAKENDGHDWKALSHAVRVTYQAIELLQTGTLTLPLKPEIVTKLKAIKAGEVDFLETSNLLNDNVDIIDSLKSPTSLPAFSEQLYDEFKKWFSNKLVDMYI